MRQPFGSNVTSRDSLPGTRALSLDWAARRAGESSKHRTGSGRRSSMARWYSTGSIVPPVRAALALLLLLAQPDAGPFTSKDAMIAMRDGVRLNTKIFGPRQQSG